MIFRTEKDIRHTVEYHITLAALFKAKRMGLVITNGISFNIMKASLKTTRYMGLASISLSSSSMRVNLKMEKKMV